MHEGAIESWGAVAVITMVLFYALEARGRKILRPHSSEDPYLPAPPFSTTFLGEDNRFVRALKGIADVSILQQLQVELAGLCNRVIAADQIVVRNRDQLHAAVAKVSAYVSIGLERIAAERTDRRDASTQVIRQYLLADIFRIGFGCALDLKWRAQRWHRGSWCRAQDLKLPFWGEHWLGRLGGLLIDRPQFYDPDRPDARYRDFNTLAEIETTRKALDQVVAVDQLFGQLQVVGSGLSHQVRLDFKNLLLTQWARHRLKLPPVDAPSSDPAIGLADFRRFYDTLWTSSATGRTINDACKADFLDWMADASGWSTDALSHQLGKVFETLFDEIEEELAGVTSGSHDPRHVHLFLLRP